MTLKICEISITLHISIKNTNQNELEIINLIIEIKKNAKILLIKDDIGIIKDYIEIMILILEKINVLFN